MRRGERGGAQRPEARAALTEVQELLHGERGRREARIEVHLARNAQFGRRAGDRVRGEASAGAGADGARSRAGRGGSAQQPCQPHAEPAEEPEPRAPGGRSVRGRAVREGRGEPRGGESVSGCHRCSHRLCRRSPPPAPLGGIKGAREAGARGRPRCASRSRRCGDQANAGRAGRKPLGARGGQAAGPPPQSRAGPSRRPESLRGPRRSGPRGCAGRVVHPFPTPFWN